MARTRAKVITKESPSKDPPGPASRKNVKADTSPAKAKGRATPASLPPIAKKSAPPTTRSSPRKGSANADEETVKKSTASKSKAKGKPASNHVPEAEPNLSFKEELRSPSPSKQGRAQESKAPAPKPQLGKKSDAEKQKIDEEVKLGCKVVSRMPTKDLQTFLDRLGLECLPSDTRSHLSRFTSIKWDTVAFTGYSPTELRTAWRYLRSCARPFRIMSELIEEIKLTRSNSLFKLKMLDALPDFPKINKTAGPFHTFLKEKWDERTETERDKFPTYLQFQVEYKKRFDALSSVEKEYWERESNATRANHDQQVQEYFGQHPEFSGFKEIYETVKHYGDPKVKNKKSKSSSGSGPREHRPKASKESMEELFPDAPTPPGNAQALFINSRLKKLEPHELEGNITEHKLRYSQKWANLSDKKKSKWIGKCINKCEEYQKEVEEFRAAHPGFRPQPFKILQKVSRTEIGIWETQRGRPERPPFTVIELFQNKLLEKEKYKKLTPSKLKEAADAKFTKLSPNDKEGLRIRFKQMVLEYRKGIEEFYNGVPDVVKHSVYITIPKKFREGLVLPGEVKPEPSEPASSEDEAPPQKNQPKSLIPSTPPPSPSKKRPLSAEFVESSSSNEASPSKPKMFTMAVERSDLPKKAGPSNPPKVNSSMKPERSPSPPKKKKKVSEDSSAGYQSPEYVIGITSHLTPPAPPARPQPRLNEAEEPHKKKKKKHADPEPEIQIVYQSKSDESDGDDEEDEEEEEEHPGRGSGRLPPFPKTVANADDSGSESSSAGGSGSSDSEESSSSSGADGQGQGKKKLMKTSKEWRDKQVEKYRKKLSGN